MGPKSEQSMNELQKSSQKKEDLASKDISGTKKDDDDSEFGSDDDKPMLTVRGGYSHTKSSKKKIGLANKGKKPWNKGKVRTQADRDKISAGVRARNTVPL